MKKRIFSRLMAMLMAVALLSTTAFAASFQNLQDAITGNEGTADSHHFYGREEGQETGGIEAWNDGNTRNVKLHEDVVYGENTEKDIGAISTKTNQNALVLDLNDHKINANKSNTQIGAEEIINAADSTTTIKNGTITGSKGPGIMSHSSEVNLTLENVEVTGNTGTGVSLAPCTGDSSFTMKGGSIHGNGGAGLTLQQLEFSVDGAKIYDNGKNEQGTAISGIHLGASASGSVSNTEIFNNVGRGVFMASNTDVTMDEVSIHDNRGGILMAGKLTLTNSTIINNHAPETVDPKNWAQNKDGGGIWVKAEREMILGDGNEIHSNTSSMGASDIYADANATVSGLDKTPKAPAGKQFDGWYNGDEAYTGPATIAEAVDLVGGLSDAPEEPAVPTTPSDDVNFDGGSIPGDTGTAIEDEATPLAGVLTLADLLNALYEHEGIEAVELPEDFKWADHVYAQAIHWGLEEGLVVDTESDPLDPDELLTVALMREVLVNFVELYKGLDGFVVTVDGEDEDLVLDLGARLDAFYVELETALADQEKAA